MPKMNMVKIDGVSYNADHAKAVGKDAFCKDKALQYHHQHVAEADRPKSLAAVYDQLVAPIPTASPAEAAKN